MSLQKVIVFLKTESKSNIYSLYNPLEESLSYYSYDFTKQELEQGLLWKEKNNQNINIQELQETENNIIEKIGSKEDEEILAQGGWSLVGSLKYADKIEKVRVCGKYGQKDCPADIPLRSFENYYIHENESTLFIPILHNSSNLDNTYLVYAADMTQDVDYKCDYDEDRIADKVNQIIDKLD
jgi:hypothetical protein